MKIEFSDAVVGPICEDREGNISFGTYGSGLLSNSKRKMGNKSNIPSAADCSVIPFSLCTVTAREFSGSEQVGDSTRLKMAYLNHTGIKMGC